VIVLRKLFIPLFISTLTHRYLFYPMSYNPNIVYNKMNMEYFIQEDSSYTY
jgi:hypothetical protein